MCPYICIHISIFFKINYYTWRNMSRREEELLLHCEELSIVHILFIDSTVIFSGQIYKFTLFINAIRMVSKQESGIFSLCVGVFNESENSLIKVWDLRWF